MGIFMLTVLSKEEVQLIHSLISGHREVTSHHGHAISTWILSPRVEILWFKLIFILPSFSLSYICTHIAWEED